jgi:uroporphyrinogen decarboxylase
MTNPADCGTATKTWKSMSATTVNTGPTEPGNPAAPAGLNGRERFLNACRCRPVDRPPVWLMRQAGRALPEYRRLKEKYTFLDLVQQPELAVEVTLQPVRRFGFDAAILFSDILVIPEALGQPYRFRDSGGVVMDFAVRSRDDIARLSVERVIERLTYVDRALRLLRDQLGDQTALIGFAGSPWTLATFMMEGGSAKQYNRALALFREDRAAFHALMEKLTAAVSVYFQMQAQAGVDALQLFDSHGGQLAATDFPEASGRWMRDIVGQLRPRKAAARPSAGPPTPVIVFSLGTHGNWDELIGTGAEVLGIDWQFPLAQARRLLPRELALQGNLAPALLSNAGPEEVARESARLLMEMRGRLGYIFNLGHGLPPTAKPENIAALVDTVRNFK